MVSHNGEIKGKLFDTRAYHKRLLVGQMIVVWIALVKTLGPRQNGCHFAADISNFDENLPLFIHISLKVVPKDPITNMPALYPMKDWHRANDNPLSESIIA